MVEPPNSPAAMSAATSPLFHPYKPHQPPPHLILNGRSPMSPPPTSVSAAHQPPPMAHDEPPPSHQPPPPWLEEGEVIQQRVDTGLLNRHPPDNGLHNTDLMAHLGRPATEPSSIHGPEMLGLNHTGPQQNGEVTTGSYLPPHPPPPPANQPPPPQPRSPSTEVTSSVGEIPLGGPGGLLLDPHGLGGGGGGPGDGANGANGANGKKSSARRNAWGNHSYADLITMAIESAPDKRLTLSQVYEWMVQNIAYFKDKGDSNSSAGWKVGVMQYLYVSH